MVRQNRISYPPDEQEVEEDLKAGTEVTVQFWEASYNNKTLAHLDKLCARFNVNFSIRFYGHYGDTFDFKHLSRIPHVKSLYIDGISKAKNVKALAGLQYLEKLSLGVYELQEPEILGTPNLKKLKWLMLHDTKITNLNLEHLKDYKHLSYLILCSHTKNIEALGEASALRYLSFNRLKKTPVSFVNKLKKLNTLKFILGGRENIDEIEKNEIEHLAITWVRGFNDLGAIANFKELKTLHVEDCIQLKGIHFKKEMPHLHDLKILSCKTFNSLKGLEKLPSLNHLRISNTSLAFNKLIKQPLPGKLKIFAFYTKKKKIDKEIREVLAKKGYTDGLPADL
jgi:protein phosphatase 1 regulatory subunit 7